MIPLRLENPIGYGPWFDATAVHRSFATIGQLVSRIIFLVIPLLSTLLHSIFSSLEVTPTSLAYICIGGFVVMFSIFSLLVRERLYINEVVLGTGFGILMGPICAGVFDPRSWSHDNSRITLEVTRIVLAVGLFAIGVELPGAYMRNHAKGLIAMVVPTMAIGWLTVAALIKALFGRFDFITCLALAACLTPTDPVISAAIIGGKFAKKHVPPNLRHLLSAESAANDGLAYPFLSISLYLTLGTDRRKDILDWILVGWLYEVLLGTCIGAVIGYIFSYIMKSSYRKGYIDRESYVSQYLALAIFTMGIVNAIGSDDLLAAFAAGCAISWDGDFNTHVEGEAFASVIEYILNCGCFFYIGAWLPWKDFTIPDLGVSPSKLVVLCIGVLLLRRIPAILVLYRWVPEIANWKEALFCGHFGPMGVGAIFISTLAIHRLPEPHNPAETQQDILATVLHPIIGFTVLVSIIIHGLSIPFFTAGKNIYSRTATLTTTLGTHSRTLVGYTQVSDWLLPVYQPPTDLTSTLHQPAGVLSPQVLPTTFRGDIDPRVGTFKVDAVRVSAISATGGSSSTERVVRPSAPPAIISRDTETASVFCGGDNANTTTNIEVMDSRVTGIISNTSISWEGSKLHAATPAE